MNEFKKFLIKRNTTIAEYDAKWTIVERAELERLREFERVTREWLSNPPHPGGEYLDGFIDAMTSLGQRIGDKDWASDGVNEKRFAAALQELERLQALERKVEGFFNWMSADPSQTFEINLVHRVIHSPSSYQKEWEVTAEDEGNSRHTRFGDAMRKAFELFELPAQRGDK